MDNSCQVSLYFISDCPSCGEAILIFVKIVIYVEWFSCYACGIHFLKKRILVKNYTIHLRA